MTLLLAAPASAAPAVPEDRCTVTDRRLLELSGLAVDAGGEIWAMSDGGSRVALYRLDPDTCAIVGTRTAALDPYDAEDLAIAPDGAFWVADTGDNDRARATVALLVLPPDGAPRVHRLTYPDGPHDAEAVLIGTDDVPVIVTKEVTGTAGVYRPVGPLAEPGPTPLMRAGSVGFPRSETRGGPIGSLGAFTVTGGATSTGREVVALRTYTDAWLYRVPPSGDVVAALQGTPVQVPLPDEPQGEAVAFLPDGTLLSGSETRGLDRGRLRGVPGAVEATLAAAPAEPTAAPPPPATPPEPAPDWLPAAIGGGIAVLLLGLAAGAMALHGRRRSRL
ncbi:esterase-like activity of phytase family protein [Pseudonocardia sp. RS11V-5]|uniref:esterase-like activity of phytase family protein n=1 Tax=Pseudonocardia terrae TaxID=2905831 RepID=UPI001E62A080|nr:esterase-like activity of phytase family protein [Pseudonocardia terrae]MCE3553812.1 esterase-like activity of phytase family protein [Pseudonocardia terrae]